MKKTIFSIMFIIAAASLACSCNGSTTSADEADSTVVDTDSVFVHSLCAADTLVSDTTVCCE